MLRSLASSWRPLCIKLYRGRLQDRADEGLLVNQAAYEALAGQDPRRIAQDWKDDLEKFGKVREKYLIYK